jgi:transposase-like protein
LTELYPKLSLVGKPERRDFLAEIEVLAQQRVSELVQAYLDIEVDELLQRARYERSKKSATPAYRDGYDEERSISTGAGPITIRRPRVRGVKHESAILPKYQRRTSSIDRTLHQLWIEGLADRDFERSLRGLLGENAPLSASTISRVNAKFLEEYDVWCKRMFAEKEFVYAWVDGIHLGAGPDDERRVILVVIAADSEGRKHLIALADAMSESEESWTELFTDLQSRGFRAPRLLIADGANGLWAAATRCFPDTNQQRCWVHKIRNVLDKVPEAKRDAVHEELKAAMNATTEKKSRLTMESLARSLERDYPRAATCIRDDIDRQLTYYRYPATNWKSIRTTNPIESIFASVRIRTDAAKRMRTGKSATYLLYALITRLSEGWNRISGHRDIKHYLRRDLALENAA